MYLLAGEIAVLPSSFTALFSSFLSPASVSAENLWWSKHEICDILFVVQVQ